MTRPGENYLKFLAELYETAHRYGRKQGEIQVVAVTKTHSGSEVEELYRAGCLDFGENRVPELLEKMSYPFRGHGDPRWHFIGPLQKNKVNKLIGKTALIHSIDTIDLAKKVSESSLASEKKTAVLIQVNTSGESSKQGFTPEEFVNSLEEMRSFPGISIEGLMTMAPLIDDPIVIRRAFSKLRKLRDDAKLTHLSMGMSNDYAIAIEEGATLLRIGSKLFE